MTDFAVELRHRCRNPKCRCKLPEPTPNPREAFCTRGCHGSFYLHRCIVCEKPIKRTRGEGPQVCKKSDCRRAWKAKIGFGRYIGSSATTKTSETPDLYRPEKAHQSRPRLAPSRRPAADPVAAPSRDHSGRPERQFGGWTVSAPRG